MYASDVFVFHDAVAFSKASYTKRCRIRKTKTSSEAIWLSVPVRRHDTGTAISEILIGEEPGWILGHLNKIINTYSGAAYFKEHEEWLREMMLHAQMESSLAGCNMLLIHAIAERLQMQRKFYKSSEMQVSGQGSMLNLAIAQRLGATQYLAGKGSQNYQDDEAFLEAGIPVLTHDIGAWMKAHPYDQGTAQFTGGLSIIDALMHLGVDGILAMFGEFQKSLQ